MRQMNEMPVSVQPALRRLARRLAIGLFLDVWPAWAVASLLLAGLVALVCRLFVPGAASSLHWLWLAPLLTALPALVTCFLRAYRPAEVVALADSLNGGQGMLLTLLETNDLAWAESPLAERALEILAPAAAPMAQAGGTASGAGVSGRGVVASPAPASGNERDSRRRHRRRSHGHVGGVEAAGADHACRREDTGRGDRTHPPQRQRARRRVFVGSGRCTARNSRRRTCPRSRTP